MFKNEVTAKSDSVIAETYYHIRSGDNLNGISKAYNIPVWQLAEWNNIENINKLVVGDSLKINIFGFEDINLDWNRRTTNEELNEREKKRLLPAYHTIDSIGAQKWNTMVEYLENHGIKIRKKK